jgi:hypothetical protein
MHYLHKEFNRLKKYAEGLGIKVTFKKDDHPDAMAEWAIDGSEITIYNKDKTGILQLCLTFYHELAHHAAWLANGRKGNLVTNKILDKQIKDKPLNSRERKHLYEMEKRESDFQELIHYEVGSKIPLSRLKEEITFDVWLYEFYWKEDRWPNGREQKDFRRKYRTTSR